VKLTIAIVVALQTFVSFVKKASFSKASLVGFASLAGLQSLAIWLAQNVAKAVTSAPRALQKYVFLVLAATSLITEIVDRLTMTETKLKNTVQRIRIQKNALKG